MPLIDPVTMSSSGSKAVAAAPVKVSLPIELLPTELARIVTHVHPIVLLSAYYLRFDALVADPVQALSVSLLPLALVQIVYVTCCLPAAGGSSTKRVVKGKTAAGGTAAATASKKSSSALPPANPVAILLALLLALLVGAPLLALAAVLFGAPLTTHAPHTLLAAAHASLLAVLPLVYAHGVDAARWRAVAAALSPVDEVFGAAVGCCVGAWLGAVPIPLDWDREWQRWPVTVLTGAYAGYVLGKLLGGSVWRGGRMEFD